MASEVVRRRFSSLLKGVPGCPEVYIKNSPIGQTTATSCSLSVHEISYIGDEIETVFSRSEWKIEWPNVQVFHVSTDERFVEAIGAGRGL